MSTRNARRNYASSPSARRQFRRETHCYFCHHELSGINLETHFEASSKCLQSYAKLLKIKREESLPIMIQLYSCIRCASTDPIKLKRHIAR